MEVMNWSCKPLRLESKLSLTDLQAQLFPVKDKLDRGPILSENRYSVKTLEGNWVERRAVDIPSYVDWKTTYDTDYKYHKNKTWKENQIAKWDNKLNLEV
ncbi:uncharacterized protein LOC143184950 [Calliopsis andreniformis]|uniref:uncharacterized protein LOC143184950 n=1 Tax=Calliopsis andreniformis TaxID=337506 RepID=UPI003FCCCB2F